MILFRVNIDAAQAGYKALSPVDRPFAGALVPTPFYSTDRRVKAVIVEINRCLYMDELTGTCRPAFGWLQARIGEWVAVMRSALSVPG